MASPTNTQIWPISPSRFKTMLEAEDRQSATQLSRFDRFKDFFKEKLGMVTMQTKVNAFYNAVIKESSVFQNKEGRSYLDIDMRRVLAFSKLCTLADADKRPDFKIHVCDGDAFFCIGNQIMHHCKISEEAASFINEKATWANGAVKPRGDLIAALFADRKQYQTLKQNQMLNAPQPQHVLSREKSTIIIQKAGRKHQRYQKDKKSAIIIQRAVRKHQLYQNKIIGQARRQGLKYARKSYQGHNEKALQGPTEFWVNTRKEGPVLHTPVNQPATPARGAFKKLNAVDRSFVALVPVNKNKDFSLEARKDNSDLIKLNLQTVKYGVVVDKQKHLIIARNAGEPLSRSNSIPMDHFRQAINDLDTLHQNRIYLRDIKPDNLAYDKQRNQINFIDVDNRVNPDQEEEVDGFCTPKFITYELVKDLYMSKISNKYPVFRAADEYAMLLSTLSHTSSGNNAADSNIQQAIEQPTGGQYVESWQCHFPSPGVMNRANERSFMVWIRQHIKEQYRADVAKLLINPARFAHEFPDHPSLAVMLK